MSVMVINCWSSKTSAGPVIYLLKFVELTSINLWAISSVAIALLIASIVQAFSKMRRVPRVIGSSRVIWSCVVVAMGLTLLSAPFWNDVLVTGSYFWITNSNDPRLSRWISLSFVTTQGIAGALMALTLVFVATGKRRKSLLVCIRTSKRMKFYSILTAFGTCVYLYNGFVLLFDELSRLGSAKKELTMVGWCSKYLHVVADTLVLYYAFQIKDPQETDGVPPASVADTRGGGGGGRPGGTRDGGACPGDIENNENGNSSINVAVIKKEVMALGDGDNADGGTGGDDGGGGRGGGGGARSGGRGGSSSASTGNCSGDTDASASRKLDSDFSVSGILVTVDKSGGGGAGGGGRSQSPIGGKLDSDSSVSGSLATVEKNGGSGGGQSPIGGKLDSDFSVSGSLVAVEKNGGGGGGSQSPIGAGGRNATRPDTASMKSAYSSRSSSLSSSLSSGDRSNSFRVAVAAAALGSRPTRQHRRQRQQRQKENHHHHHQKHRQNSSSSSSSKQPSRNLRRHRLMM
ncbi:unnamed protein product [Ectocarpus sp. 12 AP-2014]